jgi:hypothetical protein
MDMPPEKDQFENLDQGYDTAGMDSRLGEAADVQPEQAQSVESQSGQLSATEAQAAQTDTAKTTPPASETTPPAPEATTAAQPETTPKKVEPPPEAQPASAYGEAGNAARAETGAEKPEVKNFHPGGPERGW